MKKVIIFLIFGFLFLNVNAQEMPDSVINKNATYQQNLDAYYGEKVILSEKTETLKVNVSQRINKIKMTTLEFDKVSGKNVIFHSSIISGVYEDWTYWSDMSAIILLALLSIVLIWLLVDRVRN